MGGTGLHLLLRPVTSRVKISVAVSGKNVIFDGDALLHKALRAVDTKEVAGIIWKGGRVPEKLLKPLVRYIMKVIKTIEKHALSVHVVIDGARQPLKSACSKSRRELNDGNFAKAVAYETSLESKKATDSYYSAIFTTPEMKYSLKEALSKEGIGFTFAPYEGDPQMAFLSRLEDNTLVISDDDDMFKYGVEKVLCKLDINTNSADYINLQDALSPTSTTELAGLSSLAIIALSNIVRNDFSDGVDGVGLARGLKLIREHYDPAKPHDFNDLLDNVMMISTAPKDFRQTFFRAMDLFLHQPVFSRVTDRVQCLNPPLDERDLSHIGVRDDVDNAIAKQVADGELEASSCKPWTEVLLPEYDEYKSKANALRNNSSKAFSIYQNTDHNVLDTFIEDKLRARRAEIQSLNPNDPIALIYYKYEAEYKRKEAELTKLCKVNDLDMPNKQEVRRWVAALYLAEIEGKDTGAYALKETPDENGVPRYNEELAILIDEKRNIMYPMHTDTDEVDQGAHWPVNLIHQTGMPETGHEKVHCTYFPYFQLMDGDAGAFLGELHGIHLLRILMNGVGKVINQSMYGLELVRDLGKKKRHRFGILLIHNFAENLDNRVAGINNNLQADSMHEIRRNITGYTLLGLLDANAAKEARKAAMKLMLDAIKKKPANQRTDEEVAILEKAEEKRLKNNARSASFRQKAREEVDRINIMSDKDRSEEEKAFLADAEEKRLKENARSANNAQEARRERMKTDEEYAKKKQRLDAMPTKQCSQCLKNKKEHSFHVGEWDKEGDHQCKQCIKAAAKETASSVGNASMTTSNTQSSAPALSADMPPVVGRSMPLSTLQLYQTQLMPPVVGRLSLSTLQLYQTQLTIQGSTLVAVNLQRCCEFISLPIIEVQRYEIFYQAARYPNEMVPVQMIYLRPGTFLLPQCIDEQTIQGYVYVISTHHIGNINDNFDV